MMNFLKKLFLASSDVILSQFDSNSLDELFLSTYYYKFSFVSISFIILSEVFISNIDL